MRGIPRLAPVVLASLNVLAIGAPARAQYFREVRSLPVPGRVPRTASIAGDFNNDGIVDLAVDYVDNLNGGLRVFLGQGGGAFAPPIEQPSAPAWRSVASGDFNEDGNLDLAVANGQHYVLMGDGAGHFTVVPIGGGTTRHGVAIADVDRDGHQDFVGYERTLNGSTRVLVYRGNGAGGFNAPTAYTVGFVEGGMGVADLTGDGAVDIVVTDRTLGRAYLLFNNGLGTFTVSPAFYAIGDDVNRLALADLNADTRPDLIIHNPVQRTVLVMLGSGPGTFAAPVTYPGPGLGTGVIASVAAADLDADGRLDVVVSDGGVCVYRGNGAGGLEPPRRYVASGIATVADLNGDGRRDIAAGNAILINQGGLAFDAPTQHGVGRAPRAVAAADLNHDGRTDLVTANRDSDDVSVLMGAGDGSFASAVSYAVGDAPQRLALADFNLDNNTDIAVANRGSGTVSILLGTNGGTFLAMPPVPVQDPEGVSARDLNADGRADLAVAIAGGVQILLSAGNGTFTSGGVKPLTGPARAVAIADMNPDFHPDIVAGADTGSLAELLGIGGAQFLPAAYPLASQPTTPLTTLPFDFNSDLSTDLATFGGQGPARVFRGDGTGALTPVPVVASGLLLPFAERGLAAADFTRDGKPDLLSGGISLLVGYGTSFAVADRPVGAAGEVSDLATADFNGDGQPDVAAVLRDGDAAEVLLNQAAPPGADLSLAVTHSPDPVVPGSLVTYTVVASNQGPLTAKGVVIEFVPGGTLSTPPSTCVAPVVIPAVLYCSVGDILPSSTATLMVQVTMDGTAGTTVNARAVVDAVEPRDPDPSDNEVNHVVPIGLAPDLALTIDDSVDPVPPGASFTYTVQLSNLGAGDVTSGFLEVVLPPQLSFVSASFSGCSFNSPILGCLLPPILAGQSIPLTIDVTAGPFTAVTVSASASVGYDTNPANNQATEDTRLNLATQRELLHGTALRERFAPGSSDRVYFIRQEPHSSYEVVVDALAGDVAVAGGDLTLERLDDSLAVVQGSSPSGTGPSRALRWQNTRSTAVLEAIRVHSTGCGTACDAGDVFRIRAYDTTGRIARFRNISTQLTVAHVQNPTSQTVNGTVWIWSDQGALIGHVPFAIGPRQLGRVDLAAIVPGRAGGLTITHDAPYGALAAKAVGLEPGFGFTFDTPMLSRMH